MRKCAICGKRFRLLAKNRYVVEEKLRLFKVQEPEYYNAFDCPKCGCQNIIGPRIEKKVKLESEE